MMAIRPLMKLRSQKTRPNDTGAPPFRMTLMSKIFLPSDHSLGLEMNDVIVLSATPGRAVDSRDPRSEPMCTELT